MNNILIYAEVTQENYVHTVVFELAQKALELAAKLNAAKQLGSQAAKIFEGRKIGSSEGKLVNESNISETLQRNK